MDDGFNLVQPRWFGTPEISCDDFEPIVRWKGIAEPERIDYPNSLPSARSSLTRTLPT